MRPFGAPVKKPCASFLTFQPAVFNSEAISFMKEIASSLFATQTISIVPLGFPLGVALLKRRLVHFAHQWFNEYRGTGFQHSVTSDSVGVLAVCESANTPRSHR